MSSTPPTEVREYIHCLSIEIAEQLGLTVSGHERSKLGYIPFSMEQLIEAHREGFVLVAMPTTNLKVLAKTSRPWVWDQNSVGSIYTAEGGWFNSDVSRFGYFLFSPYPLNGSLSLTWSDQLKILPVDCEVPPVVEVVYALTALLTVVTKPDLSGEWWLRTRDESAYNQGRVIVSLQNNQVHIGFDEDGHIHPDVGLAVAKQRRW